MTEERYAHRIRQALNHSLQDIPPAANRRLEAARRMALVRQKKAVPELILAGAGSGNIRLGSATPYLKQLLAVLALLLGMWIAFYWQSHQYISELEEVDSALLSDELPPEAFIDQDFFEWLSDSSEE